MDWIVRPLEGFTALAVEPVAGDACSGGGTLQHCTTRGALIVCTCSGGLKLEG